MDEGDQQIKKTKKQGRSNGLIQGHLTHARDVLFAFGVRCAIQAHDGYNRFILGSRRGLLLNFRVFLVVLYLTYEALK